MTRSIQSLAATIVCLATFAVPVALHAQSDMTKEKLVGTWQLVSFKSTSVGKTVYPLGERPGGYIGLTPARFWVMLIDSDRKAPASASLTDAEAISLMKSSVAYTGRYDADPAQTADGIKITIHVDAAGNQALSGTDRAFFVRVDGTKLTLKSPSVVNAATGVISTVELEFMKAD